MVVLAQTVTLAERGSEPNGAQANRTFASPWPGTLIRPASASLSVCKRSPEPRSLNPDASSHDSVTAQFGIRSQKFRGRALQKLTKAHWRRDRPAPVVAVVARIARLTLGKIPRHDLVGTGTIRVRVGHAIPGVEPLPNHLPMMTVTPDGPAPVLASTEPGVPYRQNPGAQNSR